MLSTIKKSSPNSRTRWWLIDTFLTKTTYSPHWLENIWVSWLTHFWKWLKWVFLALQAIFWGRLVYDGGTLISRRTSRRLLNWKFRIVLTLSHLASGRKTNTFLIYWTSSLAGGLSDWLTDSKSMSFLFLYYEHQMDEISPTRGPGFPVPRLESKCTHKMFTL